MLGRELNCNLAARPEVGQEGNNKSPSQKISFYNRFYNIHRLILILKFSELMIESEREEKERIERRGDAIPSP